MSDGAITVLCRVSVLEDDRLAGRFLGPEQGATVFYNGFYYPGRILAGSERIGRGESGIATVGFFFSAAESFVMEVGSNFEIVETPTRKIATATVLQILDRVDDVLG